jgi:hypothetical protein
MGSYEHTQRGLMHLILLAASVIIGVSAVLFEENTSVRYGLLVLSVVFAVLATGFTQLTVCDRGDRLTARFGWLPLIGWSARWDEIESAEIGRTSWIDGWGLHWLPGRGTTINIWGLDCVVLRVKGRIVRVGTDDPRGLAEYVQRRIDELPIESR